MMMRQTFLLAAFGATLVSVPALGQGAYGTGYVLPDEVEVAAPDTLPPGSVSGSYGAPPPGYSDPYARAPQRAGSSDSVERTNVAPPPGYEQAPGYAAPGAPSQQQGYGPGAAGAQADQGQPMSITPRGPATAAPQQGYPQQGYPQQAYPQQGYPQQAYPQQQTGASDGYGRPAYGAPRDAAPGYQPPAQAGYGAQPGYGVQPGAQQEYGVQSVPGTRVAYGAPPAGVYAPNAAVVPGTQEAPSGPRIEDVDPSEPVSDRFRRQTVDYVTTQPAGTIIIDTPNTYLYYVVGNGKAIRYGIGVGREGFTWAGTQKVSRKAEWPDWRPPTEMIERQPYLPRFMAGGPGNPMGARALYLGSTIYRIHGTNEPQTIGKFVSSGCIRMLNSDVEDLFDRVKVGTKVVIMPKPDNMQANAAGAPVTTGSTPAAPASTQR